MVAEVGARVVHRDALPYSTHKAISILVTLSSYIFFTIWEKTIDQFSWMIYVLLLALTMVYDVFLVRQSTNIYLRSIEE